MPRQSMRKRALCAATIAVAVAGVAACGIKGPLRPPPKSVPSPATAPSTTNPATPPPTTSPALPPPSAPAGK